MTPFNVTGVAEVVVAPDSVKLPALLRIVPLLPTTKQVVPGQAMPLRLLVVPLLWLFQVLPSVVFRIVPLAPTAKQLLVLGQAMPLRLAVPMVW